MNRKEQELNAKIEKEKRDEINNPKGWIDFIKFAKNIKEKHPQAQVKLSADTREGMHQWRQERGEQKLDVALNGITLTFHQYKNQVNLDDFEFVFTPRENTIDQLSAQDKQGKKAYLVEQKADSEVPAKIVIFEKGLPKEINVGYQFWEKPDVTTALNKAKKEIEKEAELSSETSPICLLSGKFLESVRDYAFRNYKRDELRVSFHIGVDPIKKENEQLKDKNDRIKRSIDTFVKMIKESPEFKDANGNSITSIVVTCIDPEDLRDQLMVALKKEKFNIWYKGERWVDKDKNEKFAPKDHGISSNPNALMSPQPNGLVSNLAGGGETSANRNNKLGTSSQ